MTNLAIQGLLTTLSGYSSIARKCARRMYHIHSFTVMICQQVSVRARQCSSVLWVEPKQFFSGSYERKVGEKIEVDVTPESPLQSSTNPTSEYDDDYQPLQRVNKMSLSAVGMRDTLAHSQGPVSLHQSLAVPDAVQLGPESTEAVRPEWADDLLAQFGQMVQEQLGGDVTQEMRVIPLTVSPIAADATFTAWRRGLWFAPTDFSQIISQPEVRLSFVPYYCVQPTTVTYFKGSCSMKGTTDGWQPVSGSSETVYDTVVAYGSAPMAPQLRKVLSKVEGWDMESSIPISQAPPVIKRENVYNIDVDVQELAEAEEIWKEVEQVIVEKEREECKARLVAEFLRLKRNSVSEKAKETASEHGDEAGTDENAPEFDESDVRVRDLVLTKIVYKEARYRVVYVPLYLIKYHNDDVFTQRGNHSNKKKKEYAFLLNGQSGKSDGQRPFGMGTVMGGGMRLLEGLFGVKDQDYPALATGQQLRRIDNGAFYRKKARYLVFPPSQSFFLFRQTGFITLRNVSPPQQQLSSPSNSGHISTSEVRLRLVGQKRGNYCTLAGKAEYDLAPGEEETFDYTGNWCLRVTFVIVRRRQRLRANRSPEAGHDEKEKEKEEESSKEESVEESVEEEEEEEVVDEEEEDEDTLMRLSECLSVTDVQTTGGGHFGNLLLMA
eukprot:TRINITY_DN1267_c1_g1_i2.p1 TRINITY_DN1267_c1_g1~~TRINITY_DN1267_c1_g1_i2.p1  ORF type:complete len:664 (+),score=120.01 TRINITY_DN1267_c1_g1_i2:185-2176(+)